MYENKNAVGTEVMETTGDVMDTMIDGTTPAMSTIKKVGIVALIATGIGAVTCLVLKKKGAFDNMMIKKLQKKGYEVSKPIEVEAEEITEE